MLKLDDFIFWTGCGLTLAVGFMWGLMVVTTPNQTSFATMETTSVERLAGR